MSKSSHSWLHFSVSVVVTFVSLLTTLIASVPSIVAALGGGVEDFDPGTVGAMLRAASGWFVGDIGKGLITLLVMMALSYMVLVWAVIIPISAWRRRKSTGWSRVSQEVRQAYRVALKASRLNPRIENSHG